VTPPQPRPYDPRLIRRNARAAVAGEAASKGAAFLATIVVARSLSAPAFGRFSFTFALVSIALLFSDVGLQVATTRAIAADRGRTGEYLASALLFGVSVATLSYLLLVGTAAVGVIPHHVLVPLALLGLVLVFAALINPYWSVLRGHERQDLVYISYSVSSWALLGAVLAVGHGGASVAQVAIAYSAAYAFRLALTIGLSRTGAPRTRMRLTRHAGRAIALGAQASAVAYVLQDVYSHFDIVLLGFLVAPARVGYYAAAYRIVDAVTFLTAGAATAAIFPVFSRLARTAVDQIVPLYERVIRVMTVVLVPTALLMVAVAEPLISIVYGDSKAPAAALLAILAPSIILIPLNFTTMYLALAIGRTRDAIVAAGTAALVNIALNLLTIPTYGVKAAAVATLVAEIVMLTSFQIQLRKNGLRTATLRYAAIGMAVAAPPLILAALEPSLRVPAAVAGTLCAPVVLRLAGVLDAATAHTLRSLLVRTRDA
jgi:O-antigen/teichoic acid export membrane protein